MSHFCAVKLYLLCPSCGSDDIMKNGTTRRGKQNYKCRDCGRQFVENPQWKPIDPDRKAMIDRLQKRETSPGRNRPCDGSVGGLVARICQRLLRCCVATSAGKAQNPGTTSGADG